MIDIKKIIEDIENNVNGLTSRQIRQIVDVLEMQPKTDWIPCEERLPNNDEDVLVQMEDESMMVDFRTASSSGWFWAEVSELPIAWQPLPQPYKKEGAE